MTAPAPFATTVVRPGAAPPATGGRRGLALVLGGGGATGNAWSIGVLAGLAEAGLDVADADLTIGTSSGATAAAQLTAAAPGELYTAVLAAPVPPRVGQPATAPVSDHLQRMADLVAASADAPDLRRRIGAAALEREAGSDGGWSQRWRGTVAARLPGATWPQRDLLLTAVDAGTGAPVVFDRRSGVDLVDAVAASCASHLPHRIAGTPYLDGAFRRNENADLAAGCDRVLVLSPLGGRTLQPLDRGTQLDAQVAELRAGGSEVAVLVPAPDAEHLFGVHGMDLSLRADAARTGHAQGLAAAGALTAAWR